MEIKTKNGIFYYESIQLYHGRKRINVEQCKKNLLTFKYIMDLNNIKFGIIFGTLLGAIRENNFIQHDEDVDVYVLQEDKDEILSLLSIFEQHGLRVVRYTDTILSLLSGGDYIDVYFPQKNFFGSMCVGEDCYASKYFIFKTKINFLGTYFYTPTNPECFLEEAYGKDWRVPKINSPSLPNSVKYKCKEFLKIILPNSFINLLKRLV